MPTWGTCLRERLDPEGVQLWPNHSGVRRVRQYIAGFYEQPSDALAIFDRIDAQARPTKKTAVWRSFIEAERRVPRSADGAIRGTSVKLPTKTKSPARPRS